jgi:hypothetical protein
LFQFLKNGHRVELDNALFIIEDASLFGFLEQDCMAGVSLPPANDVSPPSCRPRPNVDPDNIVISISKRIVIFSFES